MHDAFTTTPIVEKLPLKIECLEAYGTKLLVGTAEGVLLAYDINPGNPSEPFSVTLISSKKTFSRKPIEQLQAIEELDLLLSLSDGIISVHDLATLSPKSQMAKSKGANLFAIELVPAAPPPKAAPAMPGRAAGAGQPARGQPAAPTLRLCVSARKKLLFFEWNGNDFMDTKELNVPDKARTLIWTGDKICVGYTKEYNIIQISTGAIIDLFPIKLNRPLAAKLPKNEILLSKDNVSIFVNADDGKPTRKFGVTWSEPPEMFGYCFPYIVGVLPTKGIEVRTIETQSLVQTINLSKARIMTHGDAVFVASLSNVWRLVTVSLISQVDQLVEEKEFEEAINLLDQIPDLPPRQREDKLKNVRRLLAYHLFSRKNFDRAMTLFQELNTDPAEVINLFPTMSTELRSTVSIPVKLSKLEGADLDKALAALVKFLTDRRSMLAKLNKQDEDSFVEQAMQQQQLQQQQAAGGAASKRSAASHPSVIAVDGGSSSPPPTSSSIKEMAQIIDTTLLKAYLITSPSLVGPLLRLPNHCNLNESVALLQQHKRYSELVDLYYGKEMHSEALQTLEKHGQIPNGPLSGPSHTVAYLQRLGGEQVDLILESSKWVLKENVEEGFRIFAEDYPGVEKLPRDKVLTHLYKEAPPAYAIRYLEYIIHSRKDETPEFHNQLLFFYIDEVKKEVVAANGQLVEDPAATGKKSAVRTKLLKLLDTSTSYTAEKILPRLPEAALYQERALLLSRLGKHDQALAIYAYKMRSFDLAEEYCQKNYDPNKEDSRDVYLSLLSVYLKPDASAGTDPASLVPPALQLMTKYYNKLDAAKALELLPTSTHISQLFPFIHAVLQEDSRLKHNNQIVKNLLKSEHLQVQEQLIHYRSRRVHIRSDTMCPVCNKRIGNSVFASYPNGSVVHYICAKDRTSAPS